MLTVLSNLSIPRKLGMQAVAIIAVAIVVVGVAWFKLGQLSTIADDLANRQARRLTLALEAESLFNSAAVNEKNVILYKDDAKKRAQIETYDQTVAKVASLLDELVPLVDQPEAREQVTVFQSAVAERKTASHHVFDLALAGKPDDAFDYSVGVAAKSRQVAIKAADTLVDLCRKALEAARADSHAIAEDTRLLTIAVAVLGLGAVFAFAGWATARFVVGPLGRMTQEMERLAGGALDIRVEGIEQRDEIGSLARSLAHFRDNAVTMRRFEDELQTRADHDRERSASLGAAVAGFERAVGPLIDAVKDAAGGLIGESRGLSNLAARSSEIAVTATHGAEDTASNVQTIAAASEELSASIGEIAGQLVRAAGIAETAVAKAGQADGTIQSLTAAAGNIGEVVELITGIAAQTRMLALNATIEAARAGEAGKGFAVVAAEVKALADQTTGAAERITKQIAAMQQASKAAMEAVRAVGTTIDEMSGITAGVAAAVEQQGAATREITRNVHAAAQGTATVSEGMQEVSMGSAETGDAAGRVLRGAEEVDGRTDVLKREVGGFLERIRG